LVASELGDRLDPVVVEAVVPGLGRELVRAQRERVLRLAADLVNAPSFSVLSPSEIVHTSGISGLTMRQPSVVECIVCGPAGKPFSGLVTTHGARLIDSTPPTRTMSASPVSTARLAWIAASRL